MNRSTAKKPDCLAAACGLAAMTIAGCTVGPNYHRPTAPVPATWDVQEPWRESAPKDEFPKGQWWAVFHDERLNSLEQQSLDANQTIKIAIARLEQARATAAIQISTLFPTVGLEPGTTPTIERQRISGNRPLAGAPVAASPVTQNSATIPFVVNYELDLFGRRRRAIESARASYQASAADLENVRLIITAELAADYFSLRQLDSEIGILNRTVDALQKGFDLVKSRHEGGVASGLDVAQEETLLRSTQTQAVLRQQQRRQFEDAISVLIGKPAPEFHMPVNELNDIAPPPLNAGLPSDLLERRPDIGEAEREMAAANAQIGVATAAYYPSIELFGSAGWQASDISKLANASSIFWAVGANVAETIFSGGARRAQVQYTRAGFDATVGNYRNTVLNAFREVQDDVTGLAVLEQSQQAQQLSVDAARRALDISTNRYTGGLVSYLDVVTAQQNLLSNEQQMVAIQGQRLLTSVALVKALGGGWDAASLASVQIKPRFKDVVAP